MSTLPKIPPLPSYPVDEASYDQCYQAKAKEICRVCLDEVLEALGQEVALAEEGSPVVQVAAALCADPPDPAYLCGSGWRSWQRQEAARLGEHLYRQLAVILDSMVRAALARGED